jgi:di/tricarboxylate transporter
MTNPQIFAVAIIAAMMALFLWGTAALRHRGGARPHRGRRGRNRKAEGGLLRVSDDIVIIVASALVVSAAIARSGIMERGLQLVSPYARTTQLQVLVLVTAVTVLSAFIKNIGALAMLIPVAFQLARRNNTSPSVFLMPMAFGALIGGVTTLVGTSPNIIVSRVRGEIVGEPFGMFDFTPVGLGIAVAGVAFLAIGYRLLPADRRGAATLDEAIDIKDYVTEARVRADSPLVGQTVTDLKLAAEGEVTVTSIVRNKTRAMSPLPDAKLREGDIVLLEGEPAALERAVATSNLELEGEDRSVQPSDAANEVGVVEGVIGPSSVLIGRAAGEMGLHERYQVNLLAVSRARKRFKERLRDIKLRAGDVLVMQGDLSLMPERMGDLGLLPLAERSLKLGSARKGWIAVSILAVTIVLVALSLVPVAIAFFSAAVMLVLFRALPMREAYERSNGRSSSCWRPHPGERCAPHDRHDRPVRGLAHDGCDLPARLGRARPHHAGRDGGDARS